MKRRTFLKSLGIGYGGLLCSRLTASAASERRPNVLFIFSDDHAIAAIGAYPSWLQSFVVEQNITPRIDGLSRHGGLFLNSYCCNSICGPSRAAILTGTHSHINGFRENEKDDFNSDQWQFQKELQKAGYQTAIVGKWHLGSTPTGFDYWEILPGQGEYYNPDFITAEGTVRREGYVTDIITDRAVEWLKKRDPDKPFMLMYQHKAPHRPWMPSLKYLNLLDEATIPEPATLFDDYSGRTSSVRNHEMGIDRHMNLSQDLKITSPFSDSSDAMPFMARRMTIAQRQAWDKAYVPRNEKFRKANLKGKDLARWKYQNYMKDYLRCIKSIDDNVGRILDYLRANGLEQNTVVIYCSDQGFYLGEHGWFDKRWMYEESLRMPFIVRWPGVIEPATVYREMIQNIDYAPTFMEMAGSHAPSGIQGKSFVPILRSRTPRDWRRSIYYHYYEYPKWHRVQKHCGVRTDRYKLIHFYPVGEWELYDLQKDPKELRNVYSDPAYADIVKKMKAELERLQRLYRDPIITDSKIGSTAAEDAV
jgi:arylsulfatase A-like enzyme